VATVAANQRDLAAKKDVIDARLDQMAGHLRAELGRVAEQVQQLGNASRQSFGQVSAALAAHAETTQVLSTTAHGLREALASTKTRGQWGERMAEDVLRLAGFVENVNYRKQTKVAGGEGLPDFTFELPKGQVLYLDVKFPMSAYLKYLEAGNDAERSAYRDAFLRDVRLRVRELAKRDYARQGERPSVDYVLLFLPNETVSTFIHEHDGALMEDAMRQKVVFCSPLTLFAMLGVIRQAHENFLIERTSDEILKVLGSFEQQWGKFTGALDVVGKRLESAQRAYDELAGPRRRQLERPLAQLEDLRNQRGIELDPPEQGEVLTLGLREVGA
jgi:DNA recombination protein RmuC